MKFSTLALTLFSLLSISAATYSPESPELARLIPRSQWAKRANILAGGGWALIAPTCPVGTSTCDDTACCPNTLTCDFRQLDADAACCPDKTDCKEALSSTPFCADDSWALWQNSADTTGYFCCLEGQIGLQSGNCVSGKQVVASSLTATFSGVSITAGAVFQSGSATNAAPTGSASGASSGTGTALGKTGTITGKPTTATSAGGNIESSLKSQASSAVSSIAHSGGAGQKGAVALVVEGLVGAIVAVLL